MIRQIIFSSICSLIGAIALVMSSAQSKQEDVIKIQTINCIMAAFAFLILGGIVGFIIAMFEVVRNILLLTNKTTLKIYLIIIMLASAVSLYFNSNGLMGLLPICAFAILTFFFGLKDVPMRLLKIVMLFANSLWIIYSIYVFAILGMIIGIVYSISIIVWLIKDGLFVKNKEKNKDIYHTDSIEQNNLRRL